MGSVPIVDPRSVTEAERRRRAMYQRIIDFLNETVNENNASHTMTRRSTSDDAARDARDDDDDANFPNEAYARDISLETGESRSGTPPIPPLPPAEYEAMIRAQRAVGRAMRTTGRGPIQTLASVVWTPRPRRASRNGRTTATKTTKTKTTPTKTTTRARTRSRWRRRVRWTRGGERTHGFVRGE